jgi:hypothetical protein
MLMTLLTPLPSRSGGLISLSYYPSAAQRHHQTHTQWNVTRRRHFDRLHTRCLSAEGRDLPCQISVCWDGEFRGSLGMVGHIYMHVFLVL